MGSLKTFMAEFGKLLGVIAVAAGVAAIAGKIIIWGSTIIHAGEFTPLKSDVAVLQSQRADDTKKTDYILRRVDAIGNQMNNLALTGRVNYVAPPPPPEALGPVAAPKGNGP